MIGWLAALMATAAALPAAADARQRAEQQQAREEAARHATEPRRFTNDHWTGCLTEALLNELLRAARVRDARQFQYLLRHGCALLDGREYSLVRRHGLVAEVRVYLPGDASAVLWVPIEATLPGR